MTSDPACWTEMSVLLLGSGGLSLMKPFCFSYERRLKTKGTNEELSLETSAGVALPWATFLWQPIFSLHKSTQFTLFSLELPYSYTLWAVCHIEWFRVVLIAATGGRESAVPARVASQRRPHPGTFTTSCQRGPHTCSTVPANCVFFSLYLRYHSCCSSTLHLAPVVWCWRVSRAPLVGEKERVNATKTLSWWHGIGHLGHGGSGHYAPIYQNTVYSSPEWQQWAAVSVVTGLNCTAWLFICSGRLLI